MRIMIMGSKDKQSGREAVVADYSRRRLMSYADSFRELASSLSVAYEGESLDRQQILERQHLQEKQRILCENLTEVSRILLQMAMEVFRFYPLKERLEKKVVHALRMEKILVSDIFYIKKPDEREEPGRCLGVCMHCEKPGGYTVSDVADMLSVLLDKRLMPGVNSPYLVEKEEQYYIFVEEPAFVVLPGYAKAVRENEQVSGDNYSIVETVSGQWTVLLSDGMGSGEKACRDSERVLDLMEKLMEAGYDLATAIHLLNGALTASEEQNMSTLDVCSVDLYSGMCEFRKVGAATTFLKSNTYVEQIAMNSLPLGVMQNREVEVVRRELIENDYVIMVTDGVTESLAMVGYEDMLGSYLEEMQETNPGEMARKILQLALRYSGGRILDDMTVVVLGIFRGR